MTKNKHHRSLAAVLIGICLISGLTACGQQKPAEDSFSDMEPDKYVTLGEYKGLEIDAVDTTVSEGDMEEAVMQDLEAVAGTKEVTGRAVKEGDIVSIDYVGKKDGVLFDGGTGSYDLEIGSGSFIEGFEEGIVGMKTGETKDLKLTFPEDYHAEDLAGEDVVFTVSLNGIRELNTPGINDDGILEKLGEKYGKEFEDTDAYFEEIRQSLTQSKEQEAEHAQRTQLMQQVFEKSKCDTEFLPEWLVKKNKEEYTKSIESFASQYGVSLDDYIQAMGTDKDAFEKEAEEYAEEVSKEQLIISAIADAEKITVDQKEVDDYYKKYASDYGAEVDELKETLDEDTLRQYLLGKKVEDFLFENAVIK
ncbi:MAG: trigger factor [Lachnospiraceae bacterium]|nr:trigger factor [Lachnospiraceae bacterium]